MEASLAVFCPQLVQGLYLVWYLFHRLFFLPWFVLFTREFEGWNALKRASADQDTLPKFRVFGVLRTKIRIVEGVVLMVHFPRTRFICFSTIDDNPMGSLQ